MALPLALLAIDYGLVRWRFPDHYYHDVEANHASVTAYRPGQYAFPGQAIAIPFTYDRPSLEGSFLIRDLVLTIQDQVVRDVGIHGENRGSLFFGRGEAISWRGTRPPELHPIEGLFVFQLPAGDGLYGKSVELRFTAVVLFAELASTPGKFGWNKGEPLTGSTAIAIGSREQQAAIRRMQSAALPVFALVYLGALVAAIVKWVPPPPFDTRR